MFYTNLETERLILKNIDKSDSEFVYKQFSDEIVTRYLYDEEPLTSIEGANGIIDFYLTPEPRGYHRWIIQRKTDGAKMGTCGFHCWDKEKHIVEMGYDLQPEFWNHGYMYEALEKIIEFAKTFMEIKEIEAVIYMDNEKSVKLAKKLGFVQSRTVNETFRGKEYLHDVYALTL